MSLPDESGSERGGGIMAGSMMIGDGVGSGARGIVMLSDGVIVERLERLQNVNTNTI